MSTIKIAALWLVLSLGAGAAYAGTHHYYYTDAQGTVLAKADASGAIVATYDYAPYGTAVSSMNPAPNGPGYTGHVNDPESGFVYMQARYYDPTVGRFLSVDPVGPKASSLFTFNRYEYVNNNPIINVDPTGKICHLTGKMGTYSCVVDENNGNYSKREIAEINVSYSRAVNELKEHSDKTVPVTVNGKTFQANAGLVAQALIGAKVVTSGEESRHRATTLGGGLSSGGSHVPLWQPMTTIFHNVLVKDLEGGTDNISADLSRTFVHEGIHMLTPGESVMFDMYKANPNKYDIDHQIPFQSAADKLYSNGN